MKKKIYVLRSEHSVDYRLGVYFYTYYIVFPGHKHAYNYQTSEEGWMWMKHAFVDHPTFEIHVFPNSEDKNIWTLIKEHEASIVLDKLVEAHVPAETILEIQAEEFQTGAEIAEEERFERALDHQKSEREYHSRAADINAAGEEVLQALKDNDVKFDAEKAADFQSA